MTKKRRAMLIFLIIGGIVNIIIGLNQNISSPKDYMIGLLFIILGYLIGKIQKNLLIKQQSSKITKSNYISMIILSFIILIGTRALVTFLFESTQYRQSNLYIASIVFMIVSLLFGRWKRT